MCYNLIQLKNKLVIFHSKKVWKKWHFLLKLKKRHFCFQEKEREGDTRPTPNSHVVYYTPFHYDNKSKEKEKIKWNKTGNKTGN